MEPVIRERSEIEKLRYAMLTLTRKALADDPHLQAYVITLGASLGFVALIEAEDSES